ncbi:ubiquitin carboxyl-terminal hydrolase 2-like, putative, partial [Bodo saltans]
ALTQHKCPGFYKMLRHLVRSDGALIKKPPSWWRNNPDCSLELAKSIVSFFDSDAVADPDGVDSGHIASTQDVCPTYGLANIGNSCYFNSALQLLFRVYGCAIKNLSNKEPEDSTTVKLLARLVQHVREPGPWGRASKTNDDLHTLLYAVQNLNREARTMFALYRQASSSSVATHILSLIEFASLRLSPPHYFTSVPMETSGDDQWKVFRADHPFEFTQNQCGQLKTEIFCAACKASGFAQPAFSGFSSLSIPASAAHLRNVQDAIFLWGRDGTPLTNMVLERCNHCKATGTWRQRHCISRFPATGVLLVTINREYHDSNGQARKWDDGVTLPATVIFPGERCAEFAVEPVARHSGRRPLPLRRSPRRWRFYCSERWLSEDEC